MNSFRIFRRDIWYPEFEDEGFVVPEDRFEKIRRLTADTTQTAESIITGGDKRRTRSTSSDLSRADAML